MKPIIILPPNQMSEADIAELRKNDLCVVVTKDPSKVKFVDPIPAQSNRNQIEHAAIKMSRILLNRQWGNWSNSGILEHKDFARIFVDLMLTGTELDANGSEAEQRQKYYDFAFKDEVEKLAREDARAEREPKRKAAQEAQLKKNPESAKT